MSDVPVWTLFAYMIGDAEGEHDANRKLAEWQIDDAVRWARTRGYDCIYLSRDPSETTSYRPGREVLGRQYMHLVEGVSGERGDDAA